MRGIISVTDSLPLAIALLEANVMVMDTASFSSSNDEVKAASLLSFLQITPGDSGSPLVSTIAASPSLDPTVAKPCT